MAKRGAFKPFNCFRCRSEFTTQNNLNRHMEDAHGDLIERAVRVRREPGESQKLASQRYYARNKNEIRVRKLRQQYYQNAKYDLLSERLNDVLNGKFKHKRPIEPTQPCRDELNSLVSTAKSAYLEYKAKLVAYKLNFEDFKRQMCRISENDINARVISMMSGNNNDNGFDSDHATESGSDISCSSDEENND
jgi:hypothetical protein